MTKRNDNSQKDDDLSKANMIPNKLIRGVLFIAGTFFVGLGILGILLPILPTTPFLLLAAACYAKSSKRLYHWLLNNKWFGKYIKNYREGKGIPLKGKVLSISLLWITILISIVFFVNHILVIILLILMATGVTIHIFLIRSKR